MSSPASTTPPAGLRLRRTLTLSDLILYGIIVIQPVAPMSVFGVLSDRGRGHVVTAILIAMVAMLLHRHQLWPHGSSVPQRRLRVYLRRTGSESGRGLHYRLEHGNGLHAESSHLHCVVRGTG